MRYVITEELQTLIREHPLSLNEISRKAGFNIKNILYANQSISEAQLNALCRTIDLPSDGLSLQKFTFPYEKNLGKYSFSQPIIFKGKSPEFAEFIGIVLGDGNLWKNTLRIVLHKKEIPYANYIKSLFLDIFQIELHEFLVKNKNARNLQKCCKDLAKILLDYGLKRGKKKENNVGIPTWIFEDEEYIKACIRGLMDTDGCVYYCKRDGRHYLNFTNRSHQLLEDFKKGCKMLCINFVEGGQYKTNLYRKEHVERFINLIGFSNFNHITRLDGGVC